MCLSILYTHTFTNTYTYILYVYACVFLRTYMCVRCMKVHPFAYTPTYDHDASGDFTMNSKTRSSNLGIRCWIQILGGNFAAGKGFYYCTLRAQSTPNSTLDFHPRVWKAQSALKIFRNNKQNAICAIRIIFILYTCTSTVHIHEHTYLYIRKSLNFYSYFPV